MYFRETYTHIYIYTHTHTLTHTPILLLPPWRLVTGMLRSYWLLYVLEYDWLALGSYLPTHLLHTDFHFHLKFAIHFHHIYKYIHHVIRGRVLHTGLCHGDINLQGVALHLFLQYLDYSHVKYPSICQPEE